MIRFGDRVRIRTNALTQSRGPAGREGVVHGFTTPSETGVSVICDREADYALNVYFEESKEDVWFSEELLEFIDHGAGAVMYLDGMDTEFVRLPSGEWEERPRSI